MAVKYSGKPKDKPEKKQTPTVQGRLMALNYNPPVKPKSTQLYTPPAPKNQAFQNRYETGLKIGVWKGYNQFLPRRQSFVNDQNWNYQKRFEAALRYAGTAGYQAPEQPAPSGGGYGDGGYGSSGYGRGRGGGGGGGGYYNGGGYESAPRWLMDMVNWRI